MKNSSRVFLATVLVLLGTSALPFEDGFEAKASTCWTGASVVDAANDPAPPVIVSPGSKVCIDSGRITFECQLLNGNCATEVSPIPAGFRVVEKPWDFVFFGAQYPDSGSYLAPIGSFTTRTSSQKSGLPIAGAIISTKFTSDAKSHRISWTGAQSIPGNKYRNPMVALTVLVTVSETRGDIAVAKCRAWAKSANLYYGPAVSSPLCRITPGKTYWLNVAFPTPDYDPAKNSCNPENSSDGVLCDANFSAY